MGDNSSSNIGQFVAVRIQLFILDLFPSFYEKTRGTTLDVMILNLRKNEKDFSSHGEIGIHSSRAARKWYFRSQPEKVVAFLCVIAVVLCCCVAALLIYFVPRLSQTNNQTQDIVNPNCKQNFSPVFQTKGEVLKICDTEECTLASANILEAMDFRVDPCDDFFQFACGGWIDRHQVGGEPSMVTQFQILGEQLNIIINSILEKPKNESDPKSLNQVKTFYNACSNGKKLEEVGLKPLTEIVNQYGSWPMASSKWSSRKFDWQKVIGKSRHQFSSEFIVGISVRADKKYTNKNAIYIDQTTLSLPRSLYILSENYVNEITAYKTYMIDVARLISDSLGFTIDEHTLLQDANNTFLLEKKIAGLTTPPENRRQEDRMYNPMTVEELQNITQNLNPRINWLDLLTTIFVSTDVHVTNHTRVIVTEIEYVKSIATLLRDVKVRTIANYLLWNLISELIGETNGVMRQAQFQFAKAMYGITNQDYRKSICSYQANELMGMAIAGKYIDQHYGKNIKSNVNDIIDNVMKAFEENLKFNVWMDENTKALALEKITHMTKFIAYPQWLNDSNQQDQLYSNLRGLSDDEHFKNFVILRTFLSTEELKSLNQPNQRDEWIFPPTLVNAFYSTGVNSISFPLGILQPPFYTQNVPNYLNYGGIGTVIGHEITHGFDDEGRQFDRNGNAALWWSNDTLNAFNTKANCIVNQYQKYTLPELNQFMPNASVNGVTTQGENIADNGGLREAYQAYKNYVKSVGEEPRLPGLTHFSPYQLFFLSFANIWCSSDTTEGLLNQVISGKHSPHKYRVIASISNMEEFSKVWSCSLGSPMNPVEKCIMW